MIAGFVSSLAKRSEESRRFAYCLGLIAASFFAIQHVMTNPFYGGIIALRNGASQTSLLLEGILWTEVFAFAFIAIFFLGNENRKLGQLVVRKSATRLAIIESAFTGVLSLACYVWAQSGLEFYQVAILAGVSPFTYAIVSRARAFTWGRNVTRLAKGYLLAWISIASVVLTAAIIFEDIASWSLAHAIPAIFVPGFFYWGYAAVRETHSRGEIFAGSIVATGIAAVALFLVLFAILVLLGHDFAANEIPKTVFAMGAIGTVSTSFFAKLTFQAGLYASKEVEDILSFFMFLIPALAILIAFVLSAFLPLVEFSVDGYDLLMGCIASVAIWFLDRFNKRKEG